MKARASKGRQPEISQKTEIASEVEDIEDEPSATTTSMPPNLEI